MMHRELRGTITNAVHMIMQKRMFQNHARLQEAVRLMSKLLQSDKRAGRLPCHDIEINRELITAIKAWKG